MRVQYYPANPDEADFTLSVTMTLKQWKNLKQQLGKEWPSHRLGEQISELVYKAEQAFWGGPDGDGRCQEG